MDNKQIIEEIDIIVRARVEEARESIKNVAKETTKMVDTVSKEFKKMNKESNFDELTGDIDNYKKEVKKLGEEVRKVKVNMNGVSFSFTPNTGDFQKQYEEAMKNIKTEESSVPLNALGDPADTEYLVTNFRNVKKELSEADTKAQQLKNNMKNFDTLSLKEQFKTIGMQIGQMIPAVGKASDAIKSRFNDSTSIFGLLKTKVQELGAGFNNMKSKIQGIGNSFENIRTKFDPIADNIKAVAYTSSTAMKNAFTQISNFVSKPVGKIKEFIKNIRNVGNETDKVKKKSKGFGNDFAKNLSSGIKSIKKFALSLLSIRTAFSAVSKASQAYLSFDTQLSASIQNSWNVLGSLLAPVLEYVAGLFSKLVSVVASFVQALTGIDLVARANAKALDKQAKSTKNASNASKQLSSIDDISTLSSSSGGDSGNDFTPITTEAVDLSPLESAFERIKGILSQIFNPFKEAWESTGAGVIQSFIDMFTSLKDLGASVGTSFLEVWTNGTGTEIITNFLTGFQLIFDTVGGISDALTNAWTNAGNGTKIIQNIADIFITIQQAGLRIWEVIQSWVVSDGFQKALNLVFDVIADISTWVKDIATWVLDMYDKYFKPVIDEKLLPALESIADMFTAIWNVAKPVIDKIIDNVKKYLEPVIAGLGKTLGSIIDIIKGIADFITGVFTGNWRKAWNGIKDIVVGIFNTIKNAISTVWNAIWGVIKGVINVIISGFESFINFIIKGLNKLLSPLRDLGNGLFDILGADIKIPKISSVSIPRLWTGHVADEPIVAQIGEYANAKTNPEIVSPVSMMKDSFRDVLNEVEFGGTRIDKLCIDVAGENFYDDTIDYINDKSERKGVSVIKEVS